MSNQPNNKIDDKNPYSLEAWLNHPQNGYVREKLIREALSRTGSALTARRSGEGRG